MRVQNVRARPAHDLLQPARVAHMSASSRRTGQRAAPRGAAARAEEAKTVDVLLVGLRGEVLGRRELERLPAERAAVRAGSRASESVAAVQRYRVVEDMQDPQAHTAALQRDRLCRALSSRCGGRLRTSAASRAARCSRATRTGARRRGA